MPDTFSLHRRDQLIRLLRIVQILQTDRRPGALELAGLCEVSRRTVFRDLGLIEEAGIVVEYDPRRKGYRIACPPAEGTLTEGEILALTILAGQDRGELSLGLRAEARLGVKKLRQGLSEPGRRRIDAITRLIEDDHAPDGDERASIGPDLLEAIAGENVRLDMTVGPDLELIRLLPQKLVRRGDGWWILGFCERTKRTRTVPIGAIRSLEQAQPCSTETPNTEGLESTEDRDRKPARSEAGEARIGAGVNFQGVGG